MKEENKVYGENHTEHTRRVGNIFRDLDRASLEDSRGVVPGTRRTVSSTRFLEATLDIELVAMTKTDPDLTADEKEKRLAWLKQMQDEEVEERIAKREARKKQLEEERKKWFTE